MYKKLTKCKTCKKEVTISAKNCPHCGQKDPGTKLKEVIIGYLVMIIAVIGSFIYFIT